MGYVDFLNQGKIINTKIRALRTFETKESKVAKLFAKHIKLKDAIETCSKTRLVLFHCLGLYVLSNVLE